MIKTMASLLSSYEIKINVVSQKYVNFKVIEVIKIYVFRYVVDIVCRISYRVFLLLFTQANKTTWLEAQEWLVAMWKLSLVSGNTEVWVAWARVVCSRIAEKIYKLNYFPRVIKKCLRDFVFIVKV